ncbi:MAG: hypothetical protein KGJ43_01045, partial [Acidobacteriota bacterium]|nr:hypothetical protein [Acidobacteriota bacterium]
MIERNWRSGDHRHVLRRLVPIGAATALLTCVANAPAAPLGHTSDFATPTASSAPAGLAAGPEGNLWFTEEVPSKIGEINPSTHEASDFAT